MFSFVKWRFVDPRVESSDTDTNSLKELCLLPISFIDVRSFLVILASCFFYFHSSVLYALRFTIFTFLKQLYILQYVNVLSANVNVLSARKLNKLQFYFSFNINAIQKYNQWTMIRCSYVSQIYCKIRCRLSHFPIERKNK